VTDTRSDHVAARSIRLPAAAIHRFYIGISVLIALIVAMGFWPSYFGPLVEGTVDAPRVIHVHAAVFSGWVALFATQVMLAATGQIALHKKLGTVGIWYGCAIIVVGVVTALSQFADRVEAGRIAEAQTRLLAPLSDMIVFPIFFAAAVYYRRRPEIHKRLMLVATTTLLVAAALRMSFLGEPLPRPTRLLIWFSPILLGIAYDLVAKRMVHPAYVLGLAALYLLSMRGALVETDAWLAFSGWLATLVS
jgi:hypothetical protein